MNHLSIIENIDSIPLFFKNYLDRDELLTFKSAIRTCLCCLRQLAFILVLPEDTILEKEDLHWFNLDRQGVQYEMDSEMLLYTLPYPLSSQRQVYNHTFARPLESECRINHLEWIVDDDPLSINVSLERLKYVQSLKWFCIVQVKRRENRD